MTKFEPVALPEKEALDEEDIRQRAQSNLALMRNRHTVRDYQRKPVPRDVIEACIAAAGTAPSGANQQPWHFVAINDPEVKAQIREAAEKEEQAFYDGGASDEWLEALAPIGTDLHKPHLEDADWLIVIFAQRWGEHEDGSRKKHYYVPESVGIAMGMLIQAVHFSGLASLTHTPNPMKFLSEICGRPASEKPIMILAVGHPAQDATIPKAAKAKKDLNEIMTVL